jgi:hypothetical protein
MEEEGRSSSWLAPGEWEVPIGWEEATRGPTEDPGRPVWFGGLLQEAERRLGSISTSEAKYNLNSDRKTQPWKILYACNDDELFIVRVDREENKRKFNLDLNKIITCNKTFGKKFLEKFNNEFFSGAYVLSFIYSITSPN